jgi:multisubunit Na+/H+ antiporter MnhE subunit
MTITIPFWGLIGIIFLTGIIVCFIISRFAEDSEYFPDIFNMLLIAVVFFIDIAICIGMIIGKYVF